MRNNDERTGAAKTNVDSPAPTQTAERTGLNFVTPTEFVEIPSRGRFYHDGHPLRGKSTVELKQMTAKEEDILTSKSLLKQGVAIDRFLQSVLVDKSIHTDSLLVGDKNALIVAARCSGYGDSYATKITCPACGTVGEIDIDLEECKTHRHGYVQTEAEKPLEGVEGPTNVGTYIITLPVTKARFEVRMMTGKEEKIFSKRLETRRKKKQGEALLTDQFKTFTVSINGVNIVRQVYAYIDNLPVKDSRFLRTAYNQICPALELKHGFTCDDCGYEQEVEVPITAQFFWPDA